MNLCILLKNCFINFRLENIINYFEIGIKKYKNMKKIFSKTLNQDHKEYQNLLLLY